MQQNKHTLRHKQIVLLLLRLDLLKTRAEYSEFRNKIANNPDIKKKVEKLASDMGYDIKNKI